MKRKCLKFPWSSAGNRNQRKHIERFVFRPTIQWLAVKSMKSFVILYFIIYCRFPNLSNSLSFRPVCRFFPFQFSSLKRVLSSDTQHNAFNLRELMIWCGISKRISSSVTKFEQSIGKYVLGNLTSTLWRSRCCEVLILLDTRNSHKSYKNFWNKRNRFN